MGNLTDTIKGILSPIAGLAVIIGLALVLESKDNDKTKYNKIFLEESNRLPTKQDTINFYQTHDLGKYIVNGNPIDVPYSEIRRVVKEKSDIK
jgi:hypothetical protein